MKQVLVAVVSCLFLTGLAGATTFVVNTKRDTHDATPGDGVAADLSGQADSSCSLRAAVEETNALAGADTILVPGNIGTFYMSLGSLRLQDNRTVIRGQSGRPLIDGVGNPINLATFLVETDSCEIRGLDLRRSRGDAIAVLGSDNRLGGETAGDGLILTGNCLDNSNGAAVRFSGSAAVRNSLSGSYLGITANGITPESNPCGAVIEYQAAYNLIGGQTRSSRNTISGNSGWGVMLLGGSHHNEVTGNYVGPDSTGIAGPGNHSGGIALLSGSSDNLIGGPELSSGNLISANSGPGVKLTGAGVSGNQINGNTIGPTASGMMYLGNGGDGILITDGSQDNLIGGSSSESGNLISDNGGSGIRLSGGNVSGNLIRANWIGLTRDGYGGLGNGWIEGDGILIDSGASANTIGGAESTLRNVISANYRFGVHLDGTGARENIIRGNYIGLNADGTSSSGNAVGVCISSGAQYNIVGGLTSASGNVISGNRSEDFPYGCGVLIYGTGTAFNQVSANYIGLDVTGLRPRRNGTSGIIIGAGAQHNLIGGDSETAGNVISGNGIDEVPLDGRAAGIHIFGASTAFNRIEGNLIGLDHTGQVVLGNAGHGIGIYSGAHHNTIGGETSHQTNQIAGNEGAGVFIAGQSTGSNLIRYNVTRDNLGLGIDIRDSAQNGIWPPEITQVARLFTTGPRLVSGRNAPPDARIDFYAVVSPDPSGAGEGELYLANTFADAGGRFEFYLPSGPAVPMILTAIATDANGNSSEFSLNGYSPDALVVDDPGELLPLVCSLAQNYPNPFNATTRIVFSLPRKAVATLTVYNLLGQRVRTLVGDMFSAGEHEVVWNGTDDSGADVASGVYFYRLVWEDQHLARKMVLLK
ncbi:MAG: T9SS type A sorting domain-containing protein [candidate division Zixibacteria bacterium]|nr:T9SS type A sorting domain-containing protein [candidate division Zixibacteria bacterium]